MEFDIIGFIQQYATLPVAGFCVLLGWLLKHVWQGFPNNYIPLAITPVAMACVLWLNGWAFTFENLLAGVCSAALAVWVHQNVKQLTGDPAASTEADAGGADNE